MKLNKKSVYQIICYGGSKIHAKLSFRNGSVAEFRITKGSANLREFWLQPGRAIQMWTHEVENRVSKAKTMMLENK